MTDDDKRPELIDNAKTVIENGPSGKRVVLDGRTFFYAYQLLEYLREVK